jgi:protease-4
MLDVYGTFKKRITDGRGDRLNGELESMAGGRVYTGSRALELGLVDELGGLSDAIAWAAGKAEVDGDNAQLKPEPKSMLEGLFAQPEDKNDDEIVRMESVQSTLGQSLASVIRQSGLASVPGPLRFSIERAITRLEAVNESRVQLIGPDLNIKW